MLTNTIISSTKPQFYEFLVVMCCFSLNIAISLITFKI